jgi:hypothetical protein
MDTHFSFSGFLSSVLLMLLLLIATTGSVHATTIDVSVDRNPVAQNESFTLTFSASEEPDSKPDFTPLETQLDILSQNKSSQSSWINGQFSKSISWTLQVMAKQSGIITIPAISFGQDRSEPLTVEVEAQRMLLNQNQRDLYLEVMTSSDEIYVQSQLKYSVRLFQRVNLAQASLSEPNLDNTIIQKLGEDTRYQTQVNGLTYQVTQRDYVLFPQSSGELTIPALTLTAQVITDAPRSRFDSFFTSPNTQTRRIVSDAKKINVLPIPQTSNQPWLPATQLTFDESWSDDPSSLTVGEPITRTLTLTVTGQLSSQLPALPLNHDETHFKLYPDKAITSDAVVADGIKSTLVQKVAIIPNQAGDYVFPETEVTWFNTHSQQFEVTRLPSRPVVIHENASITNSSNEPAIKNVSEKTTTEVDLRNENLEPDTSMNSKTESGSSTIWIGISMLFAVLWLMTLGLWISHHLRLKRRETNTVIDDKQTTLSQVMKQITQACKDQEGRTLLNHIMTWAQIQYGVKNIADLRLKINAELNEAIDSLNQSIYSTDGSSWSGETLLDLIKQHNQWVKKTATPSREGQVTLAPLHRLQDQ